MFHSRNPARRPTSWLSRRPRLEGLEDRTVPSTLYVDDSLVAGTALGSLPASVQVTDDRDSSGTLTTGDQVSIAVGETGTTTHLTYNEAPVSGDAGSAYSTIGDAVAAATAGDTVEVAAGTYPEAVTVDKQLTLDGLTNNPADVVIGPAAGAGITVSANGVTVSDLTVSPQAGTGIMTSGTAVAALTVRNVAITTAAGSAGTGLNLTGSGAAGSALTLNGVTITVGSGGTGAALTVGGFEMVNLTDATIPDVSGAAASSITLPAGSSAATLNAKVTGSTGTKFTASATSLQLGPTAGPAGAAVTLANLDRLNLTGGAGADKFIITPPAPGGAVITAAGGQPTGTTGDTLDLTSGTITGITGLSLTPTGLSGTYTFSDAAAVPFSGIDILVDAQVVTGTVFLDDNANSEQDLPNEAGVPGVTIRLVNSDGSVAQTTTTDSLGHYAIAVFTAGTRSVQIVLPPGAVLTPLKPVNVTGTLGTVTNGLDFGLQFPTGNPATSTVTGVVFDDANGNGTQDTGEVGVNNLVVCLDLNGNGKLDAAEPSALTSTVSGIAGSFTLTSTAVGGQARVMVVEKPGFLQNTNSPLVTLTTGGTESAKVGVRANLPPQATPARLLAVGVVQGNAAKVRVFNPDGSEAFTVPVAGSFPGGLRVAVADVTGDGVPDIIAGSGPGSQATVVVIDGSMKQEILRITPFGAFDQGLFVTAGDITGDGVADLVITPDQGGGPRVVVVRGGDLQTILSFFGIDDPNFRGGARAAVADLNGDGRPDLILAAGFGGGPRVSVYDGAVVGQGQLRHLMNDFFVFEQALRNGVYVTGGDIDGDGVDDLIVGAGPGGGPRVMAVSGASLRDQGVAAALGSPLLNFFGGNQNNRGGIRVVAKDLDGDGRADIITGDGSGGQVSAYNPTGGQLFQFDAGDDQEATRGVYVG